MNEGWQGCDRVVTESCSSIDRSNTGVTVRFAKRGNRTKLPLRRGDVVQGSIRLDDEHRDMHLRVAVLALELADDPEARVSGPV
jgi:hypothetical protein